MSSEQIRELFSTFVIVLDVGGEIFDTSVEFTKHSVSEFSLFHRISTGALSYTPLVGASRQSAAAKGKAQARTASTRSTQRAQVGTPPRRQRWLGNPRDDPVRWEVAMGATAEQRAVTEARREQREARQVPRARRLGA